tara:strand:+ start:16666 stop:18372 length:1707 start_codon:yes stop_codon:yes gene_type:complete
MQADSWVTFDIEADDFVRGLTKVACICTMDQDGEEKIWHDDPRFFSHGSIDDGVRYLRSAELLVAHNGQGYDLPALAKLGWEIDVPIFDTMVISRLIFPDLRDKDWQDKAMPRDLKGRHSLRAWGHRLKCAKGDEDVSGGVHEVTQSVLDYCQQDVRVNDKLYRKLAAIPYSQDAIDLEMPFAKRLNEMSLRGVHFFEDRHADLTKELMGRRADLDVKIDGAFEPWTVEMKTKTKVVPFNPNSRDQIAKRFIEKYGWKPTVFTETGKPKVDETVLADLNYPEAVLLSEGMMLTKRLGQVAEGAQAWQNFVEDGRLYGGIIHNGTVTSRCAHFNPNLGQVPAVRKEYGVACRSCFGAPPGLSFIGWDASGLELRMLAHFMADDDFIDVLLNGDIHTRNMEALGIDNRDLAKTWIYAFLYGAGDKRLAKLLGIGLKAARDLRASFLAKTPKLKQLIGNVKAVSKRGWLKGLDGRRVPVRMEHAALNTLLQAAGAVVMKKAVVQGCDYIEPLGGRMVLYVHDEVQAEGPDDRAEEIGAAGCRGVVDAGLHFNLRVPLAAEYKVGNDWAQTH